MLFPINALLPAAQVSVASQFPSPVNFRRHPIPIAANSHAAIPACSNHSSMPFDPCFMFKYVLRPLFHAGVYICCYGCSGVSSRLRGEGSRAEQSHAVCSNGRPLPIMHLVVLAHFPHAQIVRVCPVSEVSCSDIGFLLWLLCGQRRSSSAGQALACD
jgi:hypothetical protein